MAAVKKIQKRKALPKAQLGAIVKGAKSILSAESKLGKAAKTVNKFAKKPVKMYGDNKAYARAEDMNKSAYYRDRSNAGKAYTGGTGTDSNKTKAILTGATLAATAGAAVGSGAFSKPAAKKPVAKKPVAKTTTVKKK
jgi:hypothetical protein